MDIPGMKHELLQLYPEGEWRTKVEKMGARQIIAIYMNCVRRGKFRGLTDVFSGRPLGTLVTLPEPKESPYHQMSIFEYMQEKGA